MLNIDNIPRVRLVIRASRNAVTFRYGDLGKIIYAEAVKIGRWNYAINASHFICTPANAAGPYLPGFRDCESARVAFKELISSYTMFYDSAVEQEFKPENSWLVRISDRNFRRFEPVSTSVADLV